MSAWRTFTGMFRRGRKEQAGADLTAAAATAIEARSTEPTDNELRHALMGPFRADAQVWINEDAVQGSSTAMACATLRGRSIGMLPAAIMVPRSDDAADGNERLADHPVGDLLSVAPNAEMTAFRFREALILGAQFHGGGYAEIVRDNVGRPVELWPIHPTRVEPDRTNDGRKIYKIDNGTGAAVFLDERDVFHLAGPSLDGQTGLSVLSYARHSLGLAIAQERFASAWLANGGAPSGLLKFSKGISEPGIRRARADVDAKIKGVRKAGRILIGDSDWSWEQIGMSMLDAEFLAQRRFSVEEICRFFDTPPQLIGDTSKQTFANFEEAGRAYLTYGILPWVVRFEQETNRKLLRAIPGRRRPFLKLNASAIVRADIEKQTKALALGRQWGWFSANDCRRLLDLEPIGPEGDVYLTPMNMTGADDESAAGDSASERARTLRRAG